MSCPVPPRAIRSKDPKNDMIYIQVLFQHLEQHNIFERSKQMMQDPEANHSRAESIDTQLVQDCLHAERQCTKRRAEYFTRHKTRLRTELSFLWQILRRKRQRRPTRPILEACDYHGYVVDMSQLTQRVKAILDELKKPDGKEKEIRERESIEKSMTADDTRKATILSNIASAERRSTVYRLYGITRGQSQSQGGTNRIQVPSNIDYAHTNSLIRKTFDQTAY